jgi:hypothetical protein
LENCEKLNQSKIRNAIKQNGKRIMKRFENYKKKVDFNIKINSEKVLSNDLLSIKEKRKDV